MCCEIGTCLFLYTWTFLYQMFEIHTTSDKVLEMLGEDCPLIGSDSKAGPGQQAQRFWSWFLTPRSLPHDIGFHLSPVLSQTQTQTMTITIFAFMHWLLLWQSGINLILKALRFLLGTRDMWSNREIVWTFIHSCRNLYRHQISQFLLKHLDMDILLA